MILSNNPLTFTRLSIQYRENKHTYRWKNFRNIKYYIYGVNTQSQFESLIHSIIKKLENTQHKIILILANFALFDKIYNTFSRKNTIYRLEYDNLPIDKHHNLKEDQIGFIIIDEE